MTVIAAVVRDGHVHMGADSDSAADSMLFPSQNQKLFRNGEFLFGASGGIRAAQIVRYAFVPPELPEQIAPQDLHGFMVTQFVPPLLSILTDGEALSREKGAADSDTRFLVGARGELFEVDYDFNVGWYKDHAAIGSGGNVALASLHTSAAIDPQGFVLPTHRRLELAVTAAIRLVTTCSGEPFYLSTED